MSRARGTYTTLENWALDLAPTLPGAAGWVLIRLAQRANYTRTTMTVGQLMDALPYQPRALQIALAHLVAHGHAEAHGNAYCLRGARTSLAPDARTNVRSEQPENARQDGETQDANSGITEHKKKEVEEKEETDKQTPLPPQGGTARDTAAPGVQDPTWMDEAEQAMTAEGLAPDGAPADAGTAPEVADGQDTPKAPQAAKPAKGGAKVPRRAAAPAELPALPDDLAALPGVTEAWALWLQYRTERKLATPGTTITFQFARLRTLMAQGHGPVEVIHAAVEHQWKSFFPPPAPNLKLRPSGKIEARYDAPAPRAQTLEERYG